MKEEALMASSGNIGTSNVMKTVVSLCLLRNWLLSHHPHMVLLIQ